MRDIYCISVRGDTEARHCRHAPRLVGSRVHSSSPTDLCVFAAIVSLRLCPYLEDSIVDVIIIVGT